MNIVFIIGNGFDLNLGLKTSYRDFYNYFKMLPSEDSLIEDMKKNLDSDTWADLEIALGKYTARFHSERDFTDTYFKIYDKLREYIRKEEDKLILSDERKTKLTKDIISPESYLRVIDKRGVDEYNIRWESTGWGVNIINFNYSKTIEKLLNFQGEMSLGANKYKRNVHLSQIKYIHGVAESDNPILLGVNDASQIENESFRKSIDFIDIMVKPQANSGLGDEIDIECISLLQKANMVCIFGSSIGDTDKMWWELLGEQLMKRNNCRVIYFVQENDMKYRKNFLSMKIRSYQDSILLKMNIAPQEKNLFEDKIWVGYNTEMFRVN
jgi:hypothetical protein